MKKLVKNCVTGILWSFVISVCISVIEHRVEISDRIAQSVSIESDPADIREPGVLAHLAAAFLAGTIKTMIDPIFLLATLILYLSGGRHFSLIVTSVSLGIISVFLAYWAQNVAPYGEALIFLVAVSAIYSLFGLFWGIDKISGYKLSRYLKTWL